MDNCPYCKRNINQMKNRTAFRKHNISKGVVCPGSWRSPSRSKWLISLKTMPLQEVKMIAKRGEGIQALDAIAELEERETVRKFVKVLNRGAVKGKQDAS